MHASMHLSLDYMRGGYHEQFSVVRYIDNLRKDNHYMYYPEEIVEEVRQRTDIVDLIGTYVHLQKKGANYMGLCPFHNEKSPSFSVSPSRQIYHCFGCGAGGNAFSFVMNYENYTFVETLKFLAERAGVHLPEIESSEEAKRAADFRGRLLEVNKLAAKYFYYQLRTDQGKQAY